MKIQIQKNMIENALIKALPFLDLKDASKVQSNIQISSVDGVVTISATDYDMGLVVALDDVMCIDDGSVLANGKKLLDIVKILKNGAIDIENKSDMLHITQGKSKFKTPVLNEAFPKFPSINNQIEINFDLDVMSEALRKILPTVDTNNPKYEFNGALINIQSDRVEFVSTNTKSLSIVDVPGSNDKQLSIIVPRRAIVEMQKLFFDNVKVYCDDVYLIIKSDKFSFFTKLIGGKFPDVKRVIPTSAQYDLQINKAAMIENIKQIVIMSSEIKISFNGNIISLESRSGDKNEAKTEFEMMSSVSECIELAFESKFVMNFLNTIFSDTFSFKMNDAGLAFVLESGDLKTVIMPIVL